MPVAPFAVARLPRIEFGSGTVAALPDAIGRHGRRPLLVTAPSFRRSPPWVALLEELGRRGLSHDELAIHGEPSPDVVDEAVGRFRDHDVDVVVGIGGGSVLDAAKAVAGLLVPGNSVRDHLEGVGPQLPYIGPALPWIAVPTTAGTGSEATKNAVLSERGPEGFKRSFRDERLVAAEAILDPDLLANLPVELIATNGLDAVTQLLESYVSVRANPLTDALALSGLEAARDGLVAWHAEPKGPNAAEARARMAYAALLSGVCLAQAGLGAVHGLASPLGAFFPIPHGAACGATLVAAVETNIAALRDREPASPVLQRYATLGRLLARLPSETPEADAQAALVEELRRWTAALDVPRLAAYGLTEADVPRLVAGSRGSSMRTNPITLTDDEIAGIVRASL